MKGRRHGIRGSGHERHKEGRHLSFSKRKACMMLRSSLLAKYVQRLSSTGGGGGPWPVTGFLRTRVVQQSCLRRSLRLLSLHLNMPSMSSHSRLTAGTGSVAQTSQTPPLLKHVQLTVATLTKRCPSSASAVAGPTACLPHVQTLYMLPVSSPLLRRSCLDVSVLSCSDLVASLITQACCGICWGRHACGVACSLLITIRPLCFLKRGFVLQDGRTEVLAAKTMILFSLEL